MNLQSSITELKGIGEKTSLPFAKVGIHTVLDLLEYYPRDYRDREREKICSSWICGVCL